MSKKKEFHWPMAHHKDGTMGLVCSIADGHVLYMKRLRHPILAIFLVACVLFLGGVLSAQAVGHTVHHAHHNADMHSSALCAWAYAVSEFSQE